MSENQEHFEKFYFFIIKKEKNAAQVKEKICHVYRENALTRQTATN